MEKKGSPPPMRGKVFWSICNNLLNGITPAYAGKSIATLARKSLTGDHPRLCGEKVNVLLQSVVTFGITPAYAGKSLLSPPRVCQKKDHPRLCGEKRTAKRFAGSGGGSPPPMRGKGNWRCRRLSGCGITPAYAGKREIAGIVFSEN